MSEETIHPIILHCPHCFLQHIDRDEWATKPHRTHRCSACHHEWKISDRYTVGVKEIPVEMVHWVGVDFDGTLAYYTTYQGHDIVGEPIKPMVELVTKLLKQGKRVKVFTARVTPKSQSDQHVREVIESRIAIEKWCLEHLGQILEVTNLKDHGMTALYDDRAFQVEKNTGRIIGG